MITNQSAIGKYCFDEQIDKIKHDLRLCMCCGVCVTKCECRKCSDVISGCINVSHLV